jgi:DNA modification methylase
MEVNKIIQGDCLEILKGIEDACIDCVVTSPPYNLGGDFHTFVRGKRVSYGGYKNFDDNMKEEEYQQNQIEVLNQLYRVTKEESYCFYVHKERIKNNEIISPLEWLKKTKWKVSQTVVLDFRATANVDKRRFFPTHEYIFVLCKSRKSRLKNEKCLTSVWKSKKTPRRISGHPATFDYNIPYECIQVATDEGDIVLDCYVGSGTTMFAAELLNRKYIGIDISEEYVERTKEELGGEESER